MTTPEIIATIAVILVVGIVLSASFSDRVIITRTARSRVLLAEITVALEAYRADWDVYPYDGYSYDGSGSHNYRYWFLPIDLTTPVAYSDARGWVDPHRFVPDSGHWQWTQFRYISSQSTWGTIFDEIQPVSGASVYLSAVEQEWGEWRVSGSGPDNTYGPTGWDGVSTYPASPIPYDPTNGIVSSGDLMRSQLSPVGYLNIPQDE